MREKGRWGRGSGEGKVGQKKWRRLGRAGEVKSKGRAWEVKSKGRAGEVERKGRAGEVEEKRTT